MNNNQTNGIIIGVVTNQSYQNAQTQNARRDVRIKIVITSQFIAFSRINLVVEACSLVIQSIVLFLYATGTIIGASIFHIVSSFIIFNMNIQRHHRDIEYKGQRLELSPAQYNDLLIFNHSPYDCIKLISVCRFVVQMVMLAYIDLMFENPGLIIFVSIIFICIFFQVAYSFFSRGKRVVVDTGANTQNSPSELLTRFLQDNSPQIITDQLFRVMGINQCSICLSDLEEGDLIRTLPCNHYFHHECIDEWLITKNALNCPMCRSEKYDLPQCETLNTTDVTIMPDRNVVIV